MSSYVISQQYNYVSLSEFFKEKLHKALIEKVILVRRVQSVAIHCLIERVFSNLSYSTTDYFNQ